MAEEEVGEEEDVVISKEGVLDVGRKTTEEVKIMEEREM